MNTTNGINVLMVKETTMNLTIITHHDKQKNVFTKNFMLEADMDDNMKINV